MVRASNSTRNIFWLWLVIVLGIFLVMVINSTRRIFVMASNSTRSIFGYG